MRFLLIAVFAGLTSGCVILPMPHVFVDGSRRNVTQESVALVKPKVDTCEDVISKLGEPDFVSDDERRMVYDSKKLEWFVYVWLVDTDGSDRPYVSRYRHFTITFDTNGIVDGIFEEAEVR